MNLFSRGHAAGRCRVSGLCVAIGTVLWAAQAWAAAEPLTLEDAIERALAGAPQLAALRARADGARVAASAAGRLPDPELILGVDNLPVTTADRYSLTSDFMTMRRIGIAQSVPNGAKRRLQTTLAERETDLAEATVIASGFDTALAAANAWIATAVAAESLERLRKLRRELNAQPDAARAAFASGRASAADALESESSVARLDARILQLEEELATARAELSRWVDGAATHEIATLPWQRELDGAVGDPAADLSAHAPLAAVLADIERAKTQVELARTGRRPDWSAELSYADRGSHYSNMVSLQFRVGLPLFARHRQNPLIEASLAEVRSGEATREAAVRMHRSEIDAAHARWNSGRNRLQHLDTVRLPLAQDRSRVLMSAYASGQSDLRSVLDAWGEEADLQVAFVELAGEITRAWVFLHLLHAGGEAP